MKQLEGHINRQLSYNAGVMQRLAIDHKETAAIIIVIRTLDYVLSQARGSAGV